MECKLDRLTVYYDTWGEGAPIVMLHGMPLDRTEMIYEMEPLFAGREGWRRIYVDMPGHGKTPGPDWITNRDGVLDVLEEFIDAVLPGERFLVAGTSYGAYLARGLVYRRGEQIDGVLLNVCPSHPHLVTGSPTEPPQRAVLSRNSAIVEQARAEGREWLETVAVIENQGVLAYARALDGTVADEEFRQRVQGGLSVDVDRLPEPFPALTLFVLGRQDHWVGYRHAWEIAEQYPRATFAVLDGAGHLVWGERHRLCLALAADWLERVEEWMRTRSSTGRRTISAW
jgi:pimeloyl-ACP methyl ester carboxylesterase